MRKYIIGFNFRSFNVEVSDTNTHIENSYIIKNKVDMGDVLLAIRAKTGRYKNMAIHKRSLSSMVKEWRVHNLLYSMGIMKSRTKDVNLYTNQKWYVKLAYSILSPFYLHFS